MDIKKTIFTVSFIWLLLIASSFWWNFKNAKLAQTEIALFTARGFFKQIVITRKWNSSHGGIYAPITEKNRPNPYLDVPLRDIMVHDRLQLTMINPAYMTRQISEIAKNEGLVQFRITSLKPLRPQNKPTEREAKFLNEFANGSKEAGLFIHEDGKDAFFYMAPLVIDKTCLPCHAKQGYKEGEVRGGISVTLPFVMDAHSFSLALAHFGIGLLGLLGIIFAGRQLDRAYKKIQHQAVFDDLTGIPNRRYFAEAILRECKLSKRLQRPLSLIMCDIDNFKAYNDAYGHGQGDVCLTRVAKSIESSLERPGDSCARYGGEEFVVILSDTPLVGARHIAEKIRKTIENLKISHEASTPLPIITLSLGLATYNEVDEISPDDLIKYADMALYRAKEKGKNRTESFSDVYSD